MLGSDATAKTENDDILRHFDADKSRRPVAAARTLGVSPSIDESRRPSEAQISLLI
jgi:hypothetical protein